MNFEGVIRADDAYKIIICKICSSCFTYRYLLIQYTKSTQNCIDAGSFHPQNQRACSQATVKVDRESTAVDMHVLSKEF